MRRTKALISPYSSFCLLFLNTLFPWNILFIFLTQCFHCNSVSLYDRLKVMPFLMLHLLILSPCVVSGHWTRPRRETLGDAPLGLSVSRQMKVANLVEETTCLTRSSPRPYPGRPPSCSGARLCKVTRILQEVSEGWFLLLLLLLYLMRGWEWFYQSLIVYFSFFNLFFFIDKCTEQVPFNQWSHWNSWYISFNY